MEKPRPGANESYSLNHGKLYTHRIKNRAIYSRPVPINLRIKYKVLAWAKFQPSAGVGTSVDVGKGAHMCRCT